VIPADWSEVTPKWLSLVVGAPVSGVEVLLRDDGTNRRARLGLTYSRPGAGPATVFCKAGDPAHAELNARMGGIFNEARLFRSGVALPVDHPRVYLSLIDEPRLDFLLVMEDIAGRGADPRDATRPLTVDQAANGVRALGRLHGAFHGRLPASLSWVEPFTPWAGFGRKIPVALDKAAGRIPPEVASLTVERLADDLWTRYILSLADGPPTLLHGDAHIGNTYVLPDDTVGFLDWQVLRTGGSSLDLGYFLQGALPVEDRRSVERDLVREHAGAVGVDPDDAWLRYRASVVHGLAIWLATFSYDDWQRDDVCLALVERYAAAYVDLDTPAAIDALRP
jgi:aminoglycoside phosphotransferase (APT) family kinase protein